MSNQFKEQGGAATMDPSRLRRWLTSKMMSAVSSKKRLEKNRARAEKQRIKQQQGHVVEYFHQVDDGYSHLAVQLLSQLSQRYDIELRCHLVSEASGANAPEPDLLLDLARRDAALIAPYYELQSSGFEEAVRPELAELAKSVLANLSQADFILHAARVSSALWQADIPAINDLVREFGVKKNQQAAQAIAAGNARRAALKHYSGAMFYYGNEWYWGVDRLYHLEQRLAELGLDKTPDQPLLTQRPAVVSGPLKDDGGLKLEIYPSLRSPYTAVAFDQTVALARESGVTLKVLPVLPMVMRGVPATIEKGKYILFDTGREARAAGVPFGPCADPIGEPARRAYSLWAWAKQQGKGTEYFSAFLRCAWVEAINTNNNSGLQQVVQRAGLDWSAAKEILGKPGWEAELERNRLTMYDLGLWGVPSFRLLDENNAELLAVWGQDRLWLVAQFIQAHLQSRK